MKESFKIINGMEKVFNTFIMIKLWEKYIVEILNKIKEMGKEKWIGKMGKYIKEIGKMEKEMAKEKCSN